MKEYVCIEKQLYQELLKRIDEFSNLVKTLRATSQIKTSKYKIIDLSDEQ